MSAKHALAQIKDYLPLLQFSESRDLSNIVSSKTKVIPISSTDLVLNFYDNCSP
jgi:hypothetical protein